MSTVLQRLSVSALIAANEALIETGRLTAAEKKTIRGLVASVRTAFEPRFPTLIIADPDFETGDAA